MPIIIRFIFVIMSQGTEEKMVTNKNKKMCVCERERDATSADFHMDFDSTKSYGYADRQT